MKIKEKIAEKTAKIEERLAEYEAEGEKVKKILSEKIDNYIEAHKLDTKTNIIIIAVIAILLFAFFGGIVNVSLSPLRLKLVNPFSLKATSPKAKPWVKKYPDVKF